MAHEEALGVVVSVDEPHRDAVGVIAPDFALRRVKDIYAAYLDLQLVVRSVEQLDVRLAEDYEQVGAWARLQVRCHVQVGVHAGLEHCDAAVGRHLCSHRVILEGADD